jgi:hypothetical protein
MALTLKLNARNVGLSGALQVNLNALLERFFTSNQFQLNKHK